MCRYALTHRLRMSTAKAYLGSFVYVEIYFLCQCTCKYINGCNNTTLFKAGTLVTVIKTLYPSTSIVCTLGFYFRFADLALPFLKLIEVAKSITQS